jgi:hypothetical protein
MSNLARQCPRFPSCSVNNCPLNQEYPNRHVDSADKERKCPIAKSIRLRIAATGPGTLQLSGLTVAEHAARRAFDQKPVTVRLAMIEKGKASLAAHRNDKWSKQ